MRLRPALVLTCLLVLLATTLPGQAQEPQRPSLDQISDIRGIDYGNVNRPLALLIPDLPRLQRIGVNHVTLYVYLYVNSPTSSTVYAGPTTPTDAELTTVIKAIHASGMTVAVSPLPYWPGGTTWRGEYAPEDRGLFFDSWRSFIRRYAALSERHDVELFSVGSEQQSLVGETEQWRSVVETARKAFSGPLTYMTPYMTVPDVGFWDALDLVSISPYVPVSTRAEPTYSEIRGTWQGFVMSLLRDMARDTGKPVLIFETGFVNAQHFGDVPYEPSPSPIPAPQAQADAYAAVLDAIAATPDRASFLLGIAWWDWDPFSASVASTTFTPRGKPAECVLAQKWASGPVQTVTAALPCGARRTGVHLTMP